MGGLSMAKKKDHLFQPGKSGNPKGRPKGSKNRSTELKEFLLKEAEGQLLESLPKILDTLVKKAVDGDTQAAKLLLERILPAKRAVELSGKDGKDFEIVVNINKRDEQDFIDAERVEDD